MPHPGIHRTAEIGNPPEMRDWSPDDFTWPPEIAESARISPFVTVDAGVDEPTWIGERVFLLAHSHIGHDAVIGDDCEIATGAVIGGYARLGDGVKVGLNATVLPMLTVGDGAVIGAGSVVVKDVPAGETWVGNPARPLSENQADRLSVRQAWEAMGDLLSGQIGKGHPSSVSRY